MCKDESKIDLMLINARIREMGPQLSIIDVVCEIKTVDGLLLAAYIKAITTKYPRKMTKQVFRNGA